MEIACLDLEGVLIPEIWIKVAEKTGIDGLKRTTRDEPDYDVLMRYRLDLLKEHDLGITEIQEVIATLTPLNGAVEFVDWLRARFQVVILSDTFYEFAQPFMRQLGYPTLLCHRLVVDEQSRIVDYSLRQKTLNAKPLLVSKHVLSTSLPVIPTTTPQCSLKPTPVFYLMRHSALSTSSPSFRL